MAPALKVSRAALEAAAKASGYDLRRISISQYGALCASASNGVTPASAGLGAKGPGATGALLGRKVPGAADAGLGAKGPGATGACLGPKVPGAADAGFGPKVPGAADAGFGAKGPGATGAGLGDKGPGAVGAGLGDKAPGAAGAGLGTKGPGAAGAGLGDKGPGATGAGLGDKGPGAVGAGLGDKAPGAAGAGLGTKGPGAAGAGLGDKGPGAVGPGLGTKGPGAVGPGLGTKRSGIGANGVPGEGLSGALSSVNGPAGLGAARTGASTLGGFSVGAPAAGGHGRGGATSGMFGIRAGFCTKTTATAPGCVECAAECAKIKAVCIEMEESFHKRTEHVKQMHYKLSNEVATMKREAEDYRIRLGRMIIGTMVTGTASLLMLALYFSPFVKRAWQSEIIAEVDRRAAARRLEAAQGGAKGEGPGAAPPTSAVVPNAAADQGQKKE